MKQSSQSKDEVSQIPCRAATKMIAATTIAAMFLLLAATFAAQAQQSVQPASQQSGSLADVARQARAQKQFQPSPESNRAQQVADQLAEDQDDKDAPAGFRTYNAGDYKLLVPSPYTVAGNDDAGVVLSGAAVGTMRAMVLVGNPMVLKFGLNDDAFREAASQFARTYLQSAKCVQANVSKHSAYQCGLAGANLLGHSVSGQAVIVRGSSNLFPVLCVAPTDSRARDILNNPHSTYAQKTSARSTLEHEDHDLKEVWQKCESVLQSIHLKDDGTKMAGTVPAPKAGTASIRSADFKPGSASTPTLQESAAPSGSAPEATASVAPAGNAGGPPALGDIARRIHQSPSQAAVVASAASPVSAAAAEAPATAPDGFKTQAFDYCKGTAQPCWNASIVVPADAKLVGSDCKQYAFEVKFKGAPLLLLAGPEGSDGCAARSANDPSLVRWNLLVEPETKRAPGTYVTISAQQTQLDGKTAIITEMGFKNGMADWKGRRAEVEANGVQVVVGCLAPRENFADADTICSALIGSLRMP